MKFYDKLMLLIEERGITRNKLVTDLKLNKNSTQNWQKQGSKPRAETMAQIAEYFNVTAESLADDESELVYQPSSKKSMATKLKSFYQRSVSLRGGYVVTDEMLKRVSSLLDASITFLTNPFSKEYDPKKCGAADRSDIDYSAIFDVFELSDRCAEEDTSKYVMIQISKVILYRISQRKDAHGDDFDLYKCKALAKDKLDFLYSNKASGNNIMDYGFNFTEIAAIKEFTGLSYIYLLSGLKMSDGEFFSK